MQELHHHEVTGTILHAYFQVYNHTSHTYPEAIFERAMIWEVRNQGYTVTIQDEYEIVYKGRLVGIQRLDLFIMEEVVVENKAVERLTLLHKVQCRSYVKTVGKMVGLVLNFGSAEPDFARIYYNPSEREPMPIKLAPKQAKPSTDWLYPDLVYTVIGGLQEVHTTLGPGFIHRIYKNACYQELRLRGLTCKPVKRMDVGYKGAIIGDIAFGHVVVEDKIMVFPTAIRDIRLIHLDNLKTWMRMQGIQMGILANFNDIRLNPVCIRA